MKKRKKKSCCHSSFIKVGFFKVGVFFGSAFAIILAGVNFFYLLYQKQVFVHYMLCVNKFLILLLAYFRYRIDESMHLIAICDICSHLDKLFLHEWIHWNQFSIYVSIIFPKHNILHRIIHVVILVGAFEYFTIKDGAILGPTTSELLCNLLFARFIVFMSLVTSFKSLVIMK